MEIAGTKVPAFFTHGGRLREIISKSAGRPKFHRNVTFR